MSKRSQTHTISNTMKATHFSIGLGFILLLASCMQDKAKNGDIKTILFEDKYTDLTEKMDFQFIQLETNDESLISMISSAQLIDDKLYLLDVYKKQEVLVFDTTGRYITKIAEKGNGPKEYVSLSGMYVNPESKEIVLADYKNKFLFYDMDSCHLKRTLHSSFCTYDFIQTDENRFVYTSIKGFEQLGKNKKQYVLITDSTEKVINYGFPLPFFTPYSTSLSGTECYCFDNQYFVYYHLVPDVYQIKSDKIVPAYRLAFESMEFPPVDFLQRASENKRDYTIDLEQSDYISAYALFETKDVYMAYLMHKRMPVMAFYDKQTQESYTFDLKAYYKSLQLNALLFPLGASDEYIIFKINLDDVESPNEIKNPELRKVVENRKEDDNYIIALGKWKRNS